MGIHPAFIRNLLLFFLFIHCFSFCSKEDPNQISDTDELIRVAIGYAKSNEFDKALFFAARAYDLDPKNEQVKFELSKIYSTMSGKLLRQFDCDTAKKYAYKAVELFKDNDSAYNTLSNCAIGEGQFEDCIQYAKEEIRLEEFYNNPSEAPYQHLGVCFRQLKKYLEGFFASLKTVDDQELKRKFIVAEREANKILQILDSGQLIGYPIGHEPGFNEDITSRFLK
ncbi:tetratricopeptide repeat protein [Leptospira biflexa]|uniref:tetratricopeptide repeat protein n=1 Tax=Leptospira biflexa TaxID=172 RepID=UPI001FF03687|nr:hypothetical protein [Leptospira biflexa]